MSLKSLLSEINTAVWMLETPNFTAYQEIAAGLRSGRFQNEEAQIYHSVLGEQDLSIPGNETQLKNKVAIISFEAELTKSSGMCNVGADLMIAEILKYNADPSIKGFVFKMDGPGGNASVIPMFFELKKQMKKPVVALVERACSLHYYVAAILAEHIMMANDFTAECGSIGAMIMFEKPDKELIIVRPPQSMDKNQELINALDGDTTLLEERLVPLAERFIADVKAARPGISEDVLHGKVLYAKDAVNAKLADSIGNLEMAYKLVLAKAEIQTLK